MYRVSIELCNNEKPFNIMRKPAILCPAFGHSGEDEKKPFDVIYYLYKIKQFHWFLWVAKNLNWSRKLRHCQTWLDPRGMKTYSESRIELRKLMEENAGKIKSVFVIRAALWAEKLRRCVKYCRSWENILGKLVVGHFIRVLNERSVTFVTVEIFVFCGWWFSNQLDIMSEAHFSCDTVGRELWLAIFCSLLWPETDWNTRVAGKERLCVYFNWFLKWCFHVTFVTSITW